MNPLAAVREHGQSIWLDFIGRNFIASGELAGLVQDGLGGLTSNPTLFEQAIDRTNDYAPELDAASRQPSLNPKTVYEQLAIRDVQAAADVLRTVYDRTQGHDGFASLEVSPHLADDTRATLAEARALWSALARPNVMIKVPATDAGLAAFRALVAEGINVNVTLLFARERYEAIAQAYVEALEERLRRGAPLGSVASVASFFVSRIDTRVDELLEERRRALPAADQPRADALAGRVAIANAKLAYQRYRSLFSGPRWETLRAAGAQTQRVLWASTGTKNPKYRDVMYIEELIGPDTVNTVPPATLAAFRDHGQVRRSLEEDLEGARATLEALEKLGISLREVTGELLDEGVRKFSQPFDKMLEAIERRRTARAAEQRPEQRAP